MTKKDEIAYIFACIKPWFYIRSQRYARNDNMQSLRALAKQSRGYYDKYQALLCQAHNFDYFYLLIKKGEKIVRSRISQGKSKTFK
jgi:hypothetical protein